MRKAPSRQGERLEMYRCGTARWQPTARVVYQAAEAHFRALRTAARITQARKTARLAGADAKYQGVAPKGGFMPQHARYAKSPADILRAALRGIHDGRKSKNVETLYLYQNEEVLRQAIEIAEEAERNEAAR